MRAHQLGDQRVQMPHQSAGRFLVIPQRRGHERHHVEFVSHLLHNVATPSDMTAAIADRLQEFAVARAASFQLRNFCNRRAVRPVIDCIAQHQPRKPTTRTNQTHET
jgi:hypothetical protein